eukprot:827219-Amphidinium_carterae.1
MTTAHQVYSSRIRIPGGVLCRLVCMVFLAIALFLNELAKGPSAGSQDATWVHPCEVIHAVRPVVHPRPRAWSQPRLQVPSLTRTAERTLEYSRVQFPMRKDIEGGRTVGGTYFACAP